MDIYFVCCHRYQSLIWIKKKNTTMQSLYIYLWNVVVQLVVVE